MNAYAKSKGQSYYDGNSLKPGHLEIKDLNGDGIINYNDRVIIGNPDPDLFGGLTANLSYIQFIYSGLILYDPGIFITMESSHWIAYSQYLVGIAALNMSHKRIKSPNWLKKVEHNQLWM